MDYLNLLTELENYYANLLIVQYNRKPRATATIKMLAQLTWVNMLFLQIRDSFNWRTSVGAQLDIIGQWVGVSRFYNGIFYSFRPWFSLIRWSDTPDNLQGGFSTYQNFNELEGGFLTYDELNPEKNQLNDKAFRQIIGLKIIKNNIVATAKNIDEAIWNYFGGKVYTTWQPDEVTYNYDSTLREILLVAEFKNVLPAPTGVAINLTEIIND